MAWIGWYFVGTFAFAAFFSLVAGAGRTVRPVVNANNRIRLWCLRCRRPIYGDTCGCPR